MVLTLFSKSSFNKSDLENCESYLLCKFSFRSESRCQSQYLLLTLCQVAVKAVKLSKLMTPCQVYEFLCM
jgi:hypothetical protein